VALANEAFGMVPPERCAAARLVGGRSGVPREHRFQRFSLGRNDVAAVLAKTLAEEKAADKELTAVAEGKVNLRAAAATPPA
jgi:uncharacterized protein DUF892